MKNNVIFVDFVSKRRIITSNSSVSCFKTLIYKIKRFFIIKSTTKTSTPAPVYKINNIL